MSAAILALALAAPEIAARVGLRLAIGGGMGSIIIGAALLRAGTADGSMMVSAAGLVALGGGLAIAYACAPRLALSVLPPAQAGQGSGLISACTFLGGSAYRLGGFDGVLGLLTAAAIIGLGLSCAIAAAAAASAPQATPGGPTAGME
jgi:hypothetical protein